ncbi:MAG: D-alanyl-lipoteichoic acid acyltransferase DltB (MBOAT superfamily) [Planctomycetaceae bacterium]|jgi:D-alanyl-lipoteichoic acid acyltransferase DltB (MBOAT superfamily)
MELRTIVSSDALFLVLCSLIAVALSWACPRSIAWYAVGIWSAFSLALISPVSVAWLLGATLTVSGSMWLGDRFNQQNAAALITSVALFAALLTFRQASTFLFIGSAYFTLRSIHVLLDWWMGKLPRPGLVRLLSYQFFLPVLTIGPIHRIQKFERECDRRRFDIQDFYTGAERALLGLALAVSAGYVAVKIQKAFLTDPGTFWLSWLRSGLDWVELYATFSGFSSLAIGLALMMGIRLEENFNRPFLATNLVEFWTRWHITLSMWCRDYVFTPVTALTRQPGIGVLLAMIVMGLWHEVSAYYLLWAIWQMAGIVGSRMLQTWLGSSPESTPRLAVRVAGPIAVFGWLSLANPVITSLIRSTSA